VCVCVCVSVTLRYYIKTAKRRITQIHVTPHDSPMTLVSDTKVHGEIRTGPPPAGTKKAGEVGKIRHFRRKTRYNSKTVQDRRIVSIKVE